MTRTSSITRLTIALALGSALAAAPAMAQGRGHGNGNGKGKGRGGEGVPPGQMPPSGMCRIWIDGVPPGHQPAPTDCATAMRNRPSNARVLFGDDNGRRRDDDRYEDRQDDRRDRDRDQDREGDDDRYSRRRDSGSSVYSGTDQQQQQRRSSGPTVFGHAIPGTTSSTNFSNRSLPMMSAATDYLNGHRGSDMNRWFGVKAVSPRMTDMNRDGTPERVSWFDAAGRLVQVWTDTNRDGRADRVEVYQDGRRVQVVQH